MSGNTVTLLYLVASVCFIQALKGLSHPTTSIRGNVFGMAGMAIAILTTLALISSACASGRTLAGDAADPGSTVIELRSISALQERFNRDAGAVRLVLLLSPT